MAQEDPSRPSIEDFHRERSKLIDAFAKVETVVVCLLQASQTPVGGEPFAEKVNMLRRAKPAPRYSKALKANVLQALQGIEDLIAIRNDVVHSPLTIAEIGTEWFAIFVNARQASSHAKTAQLISQAGFKKLNGELTTLAVQLSQT